MGYQLYHDESQVDGYWHGILLVPEETRSHLLELLREARRNTGYNHPVKLGKVRHTGKIYRCAVSWAIIGSAALASRFKSQPPRIWLGERDKRQWVYSSLSKVIGCKFILFRERDAHSEMAGHPDHASKVETTFRMGVKGGGHLLGSDSCPIAISRMHFDGHEHHGRHLDRDRIVGRLSGLREYFSIDQRHDLIEDGSSDHTHNDRQAYDDCQLLQLADVLVGSFRVALRPSSSARHLHRNVARPVRTLALEYQKGPARMANSRWKDAFCMSECYLEDGRWRFAVLSPLGDESRQRHLEL